MSAKKTPAPAFVPEILDQTDTLNQILINKITKGRTTHTSLVTLAEAHDRLRSAQLALSCVTNLLAGNSNTVEPEQLVALLNPIETELLASVECLSTAHSALRG